MRPTRLSPAFIARSIDATPRNFAPACALCAPAPHAQVARDLATGVRVVVELRPELQGDRAGVTFDERLENWRRVAGSAAWWSATCWSAEGRYLAPRDEIAALSDEDQAELEVKRNRRVSWTPDVIEGWEVETQWRFMPFTLRMMLAYVLHRQVRSVTQVAMLLGIRRDQYDYTLRRSRLVLRNRLRVVGLR